MHRVASPLLIALTIVLAGPSGEAFAEVQKSVDAQGRTTLSGGGQAASMSGMSGSAAATKDAGGAASAGRIELVEGDVRLYDAAKRARSAKLGDAVNQGDSIVTGKDGELHLEMADGGFIAVRPDTKMRIVEFRAEGDDKDKGFFGLLQGSLRSVTGWIGKSNPSAYKIRTPSATIGIRGTDHEPLVIPSGSTEGEPGTYDKVNAGGSFIETKDGRVDVPLGRAAFSPFSAKAGATRGPRLLENIPRFFRASRHEDRIRHRHEAIQQKIQQLREDRRKHVAERRAAIVERAAERQRTQREQRRMQLEERRQERPHADGRKGERRDPTEHRAEGRRAERKEAAEHRSEDRRAERREAAEQRAGARQKAHDREEGHRRRDP